MNPTGPVIALGPEQLLGVMPRLGGSRCVAYLPHLQATMDRQGISLSRYRIAAFLAQLAHESAELRFWEELASGEAYEGRADLGNTEYGDGLRYKGRGPIQITGRKNYLRVGLLMRLDLIQHPEMLADKINHPEYGFEAAGWYWVDKPLNKFGNLNDLADKEQFSAITHAINGGYNGQAHREAFYLNAKRVLGIS